ncbi:MAG: rRNA adenine dimethylase [Nitrospirae bacterium]|nr:MAG: rRNA adenine dimethylase [Nitrospirota bacterium]
MYGPIRKNIDFNYKIFVSARFLDERVMKKLLGKYLRKLTSQGLAVTDNVAFVGIDDQVYIAGGLLEKEAGLKNVLMGIKDSMNINSVLLVVPSEPLYSIVGELIEWRKEGIDRLVPRDTETRTFLHDIPVVPEFDVTRVVDALSHRKSVVVKDLCGIVTYGTVSPEQAFVFASSTCFSLFVKYFHDYLSALKSPEKGVSEKMSERFRFIRGLIQPPDRRGIDYTAIEREDPFQAMVETGRLVVERSLVDSYFGNISTFKNGIIYISETASSLDELEDAIDEVPFDGSSSVGITASSELPTHREIYKRTNYRYILHGHPRFSVIISMLCERDCEPDRCYRGCPEDREFMGVPIVSGEVGTGAHGIVNTVPGALERSDAVIVYGHGVFTAGVESFRAPLLRMMEIERLAMEEYFREVETAAMI